MKILMITAQFAQIGGVENVIRSITKELKRVGHSVSLATRDRPQNSPKLADENFDKITVLKNSRRYLNYLFGARKQFRNIKNEYDIFHFHNWSTILPILGLDLNSVLTFHGTSYRVALDQKNYLFAPLYWAVEEISMAIPQMVTSITEYHAKYLSHLKPVEIIPNGVDTQKFSTKNVDKDFSEKLKNELGVEGFIILTVARLEKYKGIDYLIKSGEYLEGPAHILIPSDGSERDRLWFLSNRIKNEKVSIKFLGRVSERELLALYDLADVFVMPSINEGLPCSLLEAMSFGLPVIVTNAGGMPEIVTQARNGYIVKKRDSRQIAEKINFLIANPKKRKILGGRGRVYAKKHLDWKIIVKRYLTVYEKILE